MFDLFLSKILRNMGFYFMLKTRRQRFRDFLFQLLALEVLTVFLISSFEYFLKSQSVALLEPKFSTLVIISFLSLSVSSFFVSYDQRQARR